MIICPICDSWDVVEVGDTGAYMQNYECNKCHAYFYIPKTYIVYTEKRNKTCEK